MTRIPNRPDRPADPEIEKQLEALLELKGRISEVVNYYVWNKDNREDVLQNILAAAVQSIRNGNYKPESGVQFNTYVFSIVKKKIADYIKSQKKIQDNEQRVPDIDMLLGDPEDASQAEIEEMREVLFPLLRSLKPKYREVLWLRYIKGLSIAQIGKKLGLPPQRVSERIHYAIQKIRKKKK